MNRNMAKDYIVKDISLAGFGHKELDIAETEIPDRGRIVQNLVKVSMCLSAQASLGELGLGITTLDFEYANK